MADEFAKGLGLLTGAGLVWMVIAGWFRTPSFNGAQLNAAAPEGLGVFESTALVLADAMLVLAMVGALLFWVGIPAFRRFTGRTAE